MLGFALALGSLMAPAAYAGYLAAASMIVGVYDAREQRKKAERAARRSVQDRTIMVRDATADRPHLFGRVRTSGQIQFVGTSGTYSDKLHWTLAIGDELDAVEEVWFDDRDIGTLDADGWTTEPPFAKSRTTPETYSAVVSGSATVTLPHQVWVVDSVALLATGDSDGAVLTQTTVNPPTTVTQYFVSAANPTQIVFNSAQIGQVVVVTYRHVVTTTLARAKAFLGGAGQAADPYLVAQLPGNWSATDKFTGTAYLSGTFVYDPDVYPTGVPTISAVVLGEKCYDPRTDTTVWTRNPALIAWHYIAKHFPDETYDSASLIAAANVCDEAVSISATQTHARYTYDDVLPSDTTPISGLERILQSMAGSASRVAGVWYIWAGAWSEPTLELDEDDLAPGEIVIQSTAEDGVLFNGIGGRYMDATKWVEDSFPTYVSPAYVAADGGIEEVLDIDLTQITDVQRAQRVARLLLHKARQALTFSCNLEMSAYTVSPGQIVAWTIARYGWDEKAFRCLSRVYVPSTGSLQCVFQEEAEAIYDESYTELSTVDPAPNTNLPDALTVDAPVLTFASGAAYASVLADGSQRPFLRVYWPQMDESIERVELWWRRAGETTWQSTIVEAGAMAYDIYGVSSLETYVVQGRAINGIGVRSEWTVETVTVDTEAPTNFVGPGMITTPMIQVSAATEVYNYVHTGAAVSVSQGSSAGTGGTELLDRFLIENDTDDTVTVILTGHAQLTVTGKGQRAYLALDQQFNSNEVVIDLEVPTWNWMNGYSMVDPIIPNDAVDTKSVPVVVTASYELPATAAIGITLVASVSDAFISGTSFTSAYASQQSLRIEVIKR